VVQGGSPVSGALHGATSPKQGTSDDDGWPSAAARVSVRTSRVPPDERSRT
jgi:hypothetical protein